MPDPSFILTSGFAALGLLVFALVFAHLHRLGCRRVAWGLMAWMAVTGGLAALGLLRVFTPVPRIMPLMAVGLVLTLWLALGRVGARLAHATPLWVLIAFQLFRLPVEWLLYLGASEGVVPELMTWDGRNLDVIVPMVAGPLALLAMGERLPRWLAGLFGAGGLLLVLNVAVHGALALPGPLQVFDGPPANTWITGWPFIWLPMLLVPAAIAGQILVLRRLALVASECDWFRATHAGSR